MIVDSKEAAKMLNVTPRAIQKWFEQGKLKGQLIGSSSGGGRSGQKVMIELDPETLKAKNPDRYKVNRGNVGMHVITPFVDGEPILKTHSAERLAHSGEQETQHRHAREGLEVSGKRMESPVDVGDGDRPGPAVNQSADARNQPLAVQTIHGGCSRVSDQNTSHVSGDPASGNAGAVPISLGAAAGSLPIINDRLPQTSTKRLFSDYAKERQRSEKCNRVANLRYALLKSFKEEAGKNHRPRTEIVRDFLVTYNSGVSYPEIYGELGGLGRSTLYMWLRAEETGGIDGLAPDYSRCGISKLTDPEKNVLLALLLHTNRLKIAYAIKLTKNFLGQKKIMSPSSESTLRRYADEFRREHYDLWTLRREGEKALNDKVLPYVQRDRTILQVGEGLVADGHRLNFQVVNPFTGKPCRPAMVLFWDWRSGYPLGWEIMLEESVQCIATALRNSIIALGKTPKWVLLDNGKAFRARIFTSIEDLSETEIAGIFARLDINCHFAMPYNAQAKPIERFFRTFTDWFERMLPSYTGASIEDKPAWMKRNEKIAQKAHDPWVPEISEVNEMMVAWREFYIDQASKGLGGQKPREIFEPGRGAGVDPAELVHMLMPREIKATHRNGVTFLGRNWYDDNLYGYKGSVLIKYSLSDLREIYVYTMKGEFLCAARPVEDVAPMASETGNPQDMEAVKREIAKKKTVKRRTLELHKMLGSKASDQMLPWKEITAEVPRVAEAIEKIENEKRSKLINSSPFPEEELKPDPAALLIGEVNPKTGRTSPMLNERWEVYDWYMKREKAQLNLRDLMWIKKYEASEEWKKLYGYSTSTEQRG